MSDPDLSSMTPEIRNFRNELLSKEKEIADLKSDLRLVNARKDIQIAELEREKSDLRLVNARKDMQIEELEEKVKNLQEHQTGLHFSDREIDVLMSQPFDFAATPQRQAAQALAVSPRSNIESHSEVSTDLSSVAQVTVVQGDSKKASSPVTSVKRPSDNPKPIPPDSVLLRHKANRKAKDGQMTSLWREFLQSDETVGDMNAPEVKQQFYEFLQNMHCQEFRQSDNGTVNDLNAPDVEKRGDEYLQHKQYARKPRFFVCIEQGGENKGYGDIYVNSTGKRFREAKDVDITNNVNDGRRNRKRKRPPSLDDHYEKDRSEKSDDDHDDSDGRGGGKNRGTQRRKAASTSRAVCQDGGGGGTASGDSTDANGQSRKCVNDSASSEDSTENNERRMEDERSFNELDSVGANGGDGGKETRFSVVEVCIPATDASVMSQITTSNCDPPGSLHSTAATDLSNESRAADSPKESATTNEFPDAPSSNQIDFPPSSPFYVILEKSKRRQERNRLFHEAIYREATKREKTSIAQEITNGVRPKGGRFLRKDDATEMYVEASERVARENVSHALRAPKPACPSPQQGACKI